MTKDEFVKYFIKNDVREVDLDNCYIQNVRFTLPKTDTVVGFNTSRCYIYNLKILNNLSEYFNYPEIITIYV